MRTAARLFSCSLSADESPEHGNFSPESLGGGSVRMILTVADPDAVFAKAIAAGAKEVVPVAEAYGWRLGRVCKSSPSFVPIALQSSLSTAVRDLRSRDFRANPSCR